MKKIVLLITLLLLTGFSCSKQKDCKVATQGGDMHKEQSALSEDNASALNSTDDMGAKPIQASDWVLANNRFALESLKRLDSRGNLVFSPYSFERALGMTGAGARGETRAQMLNALGFNANVSNLDVAGQEVEEQILSVKDESFALRIANRLYVNNDFELLADYSASVKKHYRSSVEALDFAASPEPSRKHINDWVAQTTNDRIKDLLPPNSIDEMTRLVLVNALYFKAAWKDSFDEEDTKSLPFKGASATNVVSTMLQIEEMRAYKGEGFNALILPYAPFAQFGMLLMLPHADDGVDALSQKLTAEKVGEILASNDVYSVSLQLPKFKIESTIGASKLLNDLGMELPFTAQADFSGIDANNSLHISDVYHKAFIEIDENGTEAAAATAVAMMLASMPIKREELDFIVDHPFLFAIVHLDTQSILFLGRVKDIN
ncbi:MAG: serpin family protein [Bradymonadales bacterium]|jgi:serpin B